MVSKWSVQGQSTVAGRTEMYKAYTVARQLRTRLVEKLSTTPNEH
jgi:hypothetical protein